MKMILIGTVAALSGFIMVFAILSLRPDIEPEPEQIRTIRMSYDSDINFMNIVARWLSQEQTDTLANPEGTLTIKRYRRLFRQVAVLNDSQAVIIYMLEEK